MYSGQRHTDNGEAMAHNRMVEQAREAEHLRRCDQSPAATWPCCFVNE